LQPAAFGGRPTPYTAQTSLAKNMTSNDDAIVTFIMLNDDQVKRCATKEGRTDERESAQERGKGEVMSRAKTNIRLHLVLHTVVLSVVARSRVDKSNPMHRRDCTTQTDV
jgi:hypothetical protein